MFKDTCVFCDIVKKSVFSKVVFEDNRIMAFEDSNPQAPVHVVIISKTHIDKISDLHDEDTRLIGSMIMKANQIAGQKGVAESGYRIVANCNKDAGQAVFHLHIHLLGGRQMRWPPG